MLPDLAEIFFDYHFVVEQSEKFYQQNVAKRRGAKRVAVEGIIPNSEKKNKPDTESVCENSEVENHHQIKKRDDV